MQQSTHNQQILPTCFKPAIENQNVLSIS